ncbi:MULTISPECIES: efflux RND transporter periplasmic adaptor subunit [Pseudomonas]|uniref:efflux RND transporter periplasmic adaptor subunit n=1 Tax=Pseudomonas TaxID=286 RepID=UPI001553A0BD|nr:efflux RND transporter periplasmic adaptor subunit [Pseudomonas tumuqii]
MSKKINQRLLLGMAFAVVHMLLSGCDSKEAPPPALLDIPFVTVAAQDVNIPLDVIGETIGSTDVTIRARVDGFLDGIHFKEGTFVDKGALLYTIDPQPFQAKVAQAQAMLAQAGTSLVKTKSDLNRIRPLAEINAVSKLDLDAAVANHDAAKSYVEAARAQVELAQIELGYTRIHAPERGLIGLSEAEIGDFVSQRNNGGLLNVISRTDPIAVRVSITERGYLNAARRLADQQQGNRPANGGLDNMGKLPLTLILADGSLYEHRGVPTKVDRNIDPTTGSLTIEAEFPNREGLLRPGMFARIRFDAAELKGAIVLPQRAVSELQSAYRVFVVKPDDTVEVRQVQVGQRLGSGWVIESGLQPGERVAVAGLLRLRPGMTVSPRPAEANELPPTAAKGA